MHLAAHVLIMIHILQKIVQDQNVHITPVPMEEKMDIKHVIQLNLDNLVDLEEIQIVVMNLLNVI